MTALKIKTKPFFIREKNPQKKNVVAKRAVSARNVLFFKPVLRVYLLDTHGLCFRTMRG